MSRSATTPTTARTFITTPDNASVCSLATTISVNWEDEKTGNTSSPAVAIPASAAVERGGEAATRTGSLIIRNLFIIGFLVPLAWIIAIIKVFVLDCSRSSSPATSASGQTDIEANILPKEEKYCEGRYWAYLCMVAGTVYVAGGMTIAGILCVEKQHWSA
ncbi:hypothetical protein C7212DRAFT_316474 [Tuber magnatum]|uniref:Uncharacterized protein n=1 Tax=Tuber magnatum TaxID=42249 RepID=A0A317SWD6_9PEZI|nr:hypothetical protein C7212DRAFT_316474 [Tuber magnatum]